jgi:hypothetical protein
VLVAITAEEVAANDRNSGFVAKNTHCANNLSDLAADVVRKT